MAKLTLGCDLSGVSVTSVVPDSKTIPAERTVCKSTNGSYIREYTTGNVAVVCDGTTSYLRSGTTNHTVTIPEGFGVISEVDEGSVSWPYLQRGASVNAYAQTTDEELVPVGELFHTESVKSLPFTVSASGHKSSSGSSAIPAVAGFKPIGVIGFAVNEESSGTPSPISDLIISNPQVWITTGGYLGYIYRVDNTSSSAAASISLEWTVLYVHN